VPNFFDALTMACVADELRRKVLGGRVQRVVLPEALSLGLEIYNRHGRHDLVASADSEMGGVRLSSEKPRRGVEKETGLLLLLRKYARGALLSAVDQPPFERILRLELDHPAWGCTTLFAEVMGRHSNLILVEAGGRILDAAKHIAPQLNPKRPILPGLPYLPPPVQDKLSPSDLTESSLRQILAAPDAKTQVWQALVAGLRGMSPLLAREVAYRAFGRPQLTAANVEQPAPLLDAIEELLAPLRSGEWQPCLLLEDGQVVAYAPYTVTHRGRTSSLPSISQAIEAYTASVAGADPYAGAKEPVAGSIRAARARLEKRREAVQLALHHAAEAGRWRQYGEWILIHAHSIVPGQTELVADTGSSETLTIPLDPDRSPSGNAQLCFARYRKAQRAAHSSPGRLEEVELALRDLEQLETDLALAASRPEIDAVRASLIEAGHVRAKGRPRGPVPHSAPLSVTSPDGLNILVGRNSRQNDEVTFRWAKAEDWWFHARGVPGAHVVVRSAGRTPPPATVQQAAELAAYYSQSRREASVDVDYTERRHVRRVPSAAPGLVTYSQERTIRAIPRPWDPAAKESDTTP